MQHGLYNCRIWKTQQISVKAINFFSRDAMIEAQKTETKEIILKISYRFSNRLHSKEQLSVSNPPRGQDEMEERAPPRKARVRRRNCHESRLQVTTFWREIADKVTKFQ